MKLKRDMFKLSTLAPNYISQESVNNHILVEDVGT